MFPDDIMNRAGEVIAACREQKVTLAVAESCTGGLVAGALSEVPGASEVLNGGFVTYSDILKNRVLGVDERTLERFGAVSEQAAREMAEGALKAGIAALSVAVTGVAGPEGGSKDKPVGLVHFATARRGEKGVATHHEARTFRNDGRTEIRLAAVRHALAMLLAETGQN